MTETNHKVKAEIEADIQFFRRSEIASTISAIPSLDVGYSMIRKIVGIPRAIRDIKLMDAQLGTLLAFQEAGAGEKLSLDCEAYGPQAE